MVQGTIVHRMAPVMRRLYEQLAEPKYVIACGGCAVSGGPFKNSYCVVPGVDQIIPVDVYPWLSSASGSDVLRAYAQLQRKIKVQKFFGGANRKEKIEEFFAEHPEEKGKDWLTSTQKHHERHKR